MTSANPTLLIGLGAFGRAVTQLISPPTPEPAAEPLTRLLTVTARDDQPSASGDGNDLFDTEKALAEQRALQVIDVADRMLTGSPRELVATITADAITRSRRLLELGYFVDTTAPTDARGPRLDLFVIADLGEAGVAQVVAPLVAELAHKLRRRYRPILGAGQGHLAVCPMLVAPRSRTDNAHMAACIQDLAQLARHRDIERRPQARVYLVEDLSGKYLLPMTELARSFAAFLSLVLMSHLRDDRGVRDLVEDAGDDRQGPLATFACATLEIDMALLSELCAHQLARDMLTHYGPGQLTLAEIASEAQPLVPERTSLEASLWQEGDEGSLEDYLQPPSLLVPDIGWTDSPEQIVEQKFGPTWQLEIKHRIDSFRDQVERFKMDRLAKRIEKNGTQLAAETEAALMERIVRDALESPRGPSRALEFTRYAATRARGFMDESKRAIDAPDLRALPKSPLDGGVKAIQEAARAWPRRQPTRIWTFAILAMIAGTFAVGGLVHVVLSTLLETPHPVLSGLLGAVFTATAIGYKVWGHIKRHHNWLTQARHDLEQALQRHLQTDVVAYFRSRLAYTRALWTYRIYRRLTARLDDVVAQLEGARAALEESARHLQAHQHDIRKRRLGESAHGILYRSVLAPGTVDEVYHATRPPDISALASRFHAHVTGADQDGDQNSDQNAAASDILEAPYADPERALAFTRREFSHLAESSPYEESESPLHSAVAGSVQRYLEQLALKLSPPLEVMSTRAGDAPSARRIVIAPPAARELIAGILSRGNLDRGWDVRSVSNDARRIHLLLERGHLPAIAVAVAQPRVEPENPASDSTSASGPPRGIGAP